MKPTALKVLKGTARKDRLNPNEPMPDKVKIPKPPSMDLGKSALDEWTRITRELVSVNVLTVEDYSMLEMYCFYFGEWKDAAEIIKKKGSVKDGRVRPEVRIAGDAFEKAFKVGTAFGITPVSRAKINAPATKKGDPFDSV